MVTEVIRTVRKFGKGGGYTSLPSAWVGKDVEVKLLEKGIDVKEISWKSIEKLIDEKIEAAKRGY